MPLEPASEADKETENLKLKQDCQWLQGHLLAQTVFQLRLSSSFFLSSCLPPRNFPIFLLKMVSSQVLESVIVLLFFLKVDQGIILQIIVPYLFYQCLVKFLKKLCSLDFWIFLILNTFIMIFSLVLWPSTQLSMHVQLLNYLHSALDSGLIPSALFLDVRKALDSLMHKILLLKLSHIGIRGIAYSWFLSYLSGQVISVDSHFSNPSGIEFDVSQGSVIGPILFSIYVKDLKNEIKNLKSTIFCRLCQPVSVTNCDRSSSLLDPLIAFADDSTLGTTGRTESDHASKMMALFERVIQWFDVIYPALNIGK
ncbi:uncharacterized protein LOC136029581 [Artemia franciscana]|uniref:uncharacterized protein LOC136029581 n=1 Tax=Artemia franciscana TaxID=6661 RepID=UPI0032DB91DA